MFTNHYKLIVKDEVPYHHDKELRIQELLLEYNGNKEPEEIKNVLTAYFKKNKGFNLLNLYEEFGDEIIIYDKELEEVTIDLRST